jgi:hypothetical protein
MLLVISSLLLRIKSGGKYEIKATDLAVLIVPLLVVAVATGKVKGLDLFGVKADFSELWSDAAKAKIEGEVRGTTVQSVQDAVEVMHIGMKGGVEELQRLLKRKIDALEFKIGQNAYYGPAIKTYFLALSADSHLRMIVVKDPDGKLFGVFDAAALMDYLTSAGDEAYAHFALLLNSKNPSEWAELSKLPGFIGPADAVNVRTSKRDALVQLEKLNRDTLPVIDDEGRFLGQVERSRLTASLILAVTNKVEAK